MSDAQRSERELFTRLDKEMGGQGVAWDERVERRGRPAKTSSDPNKLFDAWAFEDTDSPDSYVDETYDIAMVYTRSKNKHDHGDKMSCTVPPLMNGEVQQLIKRDIVPAYRSVQDFMRDAMYHRLMFWNQLLELPPETQRMLVIEWQLSLNEQELERVVNVGKVIADMQTVLQQLVASGDVDSAWSYITRTRTNVQLMDEHLKFRAEQVLQQYEMMLAPPSE